MGRNVNSTLICLLIPHSDIPILPCSPLMIKSMCDKYPSNDGSNEPMPKLNARFATLTNICMLEMEKAKTVNIYINDRIEGETIFLSINL